MKNLLAWLDVHFEDALCGVLLVGIMIMLMAQVVVRFAFGHGLTFSEELCRFSFLYLVYFAASLVACKGAHIRVTAHTQKLPAPVRVGLLMLARVQRHGDLSGRAAHRQHVHPPYGVGQYAA